MVFQIKVILAKKVIICRVMKFPAARFPTFKFTGCFSWPSKKLRNSFQRAQHLPLRGILRVVAEVQEVKSI